jgi:hypothetical protein
MNQGKFVHPVPYDGRLTFAHRGGCLSQVRYYLLSFFHFLINMERVVGTHGALSI